MALNGTANPHAASHASGAIDASGTLPEVGPVRVGAVRYLNTVPLVEGLHKADGLHLRLEPPARLIDLLAPAPPAAPELDIALCSIIDYQRSPVPLEILPVGVIASEGPTRTVRVFSRVPLDRVRVLHADIESHTSVALATIVLGDQFGRCPTIEAFDSSTSAGGRWPDAVLLIGDKTMIAAPARSTHPHQLDLGAAWRELTGLPFVYAAWMARAGEYEARPELRTAAALIDRQRRRNAMRTGRIAADHASRLGWANEDALDYMANELRFELDDAMVQSVALFFERAAAHAIIAEARPIRIAGAT